MLMPSPVVFAAIILGGVVVTYIPVVQIHVEIISVIRLVLLAIVQVRVVRVRPAWNAVLVPVIVRLNLLVLQVSIYVISLIVIVPAATT